MSGIELGERIAQEGWTLPIIFITAFDAPRFKDRVSALGCIAYLLKPFASNDLIEAIDRISPVR
jgi:FixJ family two-component response regulator